MLNLIMLKFLWVSLADITTVIVKRLLFLQYENYECVTFYVIIIVTVIVRIK